MYKKQIAIIGVTLSAFAVAVAAFTGTLYPTADGTYAAWTTSSGSTHYTLVDETSCNGTTDYVTTGTVGARDSYPVNLSSVPDGATITNISITPCASKSKNSGTSIMDVFYRLDGVNSSDAGAYSLTGTTPVTLSSTNFSGLSVVKSSSTTLEIGAKYSSGSTAARLSRLATVITYTPLPPAAPSNLTATVVATGTSKYISLSWTDNSSDESGFSIERSLDGINFTYLASTTANVTSKNDFAVATGTTYYYQVKATNGGGSSAYSNTASATP